MRVGGVWVQFGVLLVVLLVQLADLRAQSMQELEERKRRTLERIETTRQLIEEVGQQRAHSLRQIELLQSQIASRTAVIEQVAHQISLCQAAIGVRSRAIEAQAAELRELKGAYAQFLRQLQFRRGEGNVIFALLASESVSQLYRRVQFYRDYLGYQRARHDTIRAVEMRLRAERDSLAAERASLERLRMEELEGRAKLERERTTYDGAVSRMSRRASDLQAELQREQGRVAQINAAIAKLLEEEAAQQKARVRDAQYARLSKRFEQNRGKLPWPVRKGTITRGYGRQTSKVFKGVSTQSMGVDIATSRGAMAYSVFSGVVSKIAHIPGGQNVVIVRHGDYLTLYSNIGEVHVHAGERIQANSPIGKIHTPKGESHGVLHFEIWKGFTSQNPSLWLVP